MLFQVTIYFPIRLYVAIKHSLPVVERFSELGRHRTSSEMEREYQRLLIRDTNPLSFLYNGKYYALVGGALY